MKVQVVSGTDGSLPVLRSGMVEALVRAQSIRRFALTGETPERDGKVSQPFCHVYLLFSAMQCSGDELTEWIVTVHKQGGWTVIEPLEGVLVLCAPENYYSVVKRLSWKFPVEMLETVGKTTLRNGDPPP